jgi:hypothetical protein
VNARFAGIAIYATGVAMFFVGLFGVCGELWGPSGAFALFLGGGVVLLAGAGVLTWVSRGNRLLRPHVFVLATCALAVALHAYETIFHDLNFFMVGTFLWSLAPYAVCLVVAALSASAIPAAAGAITALLFDLNAHNLVFVNPTSSTAGLALLFVPLWNLLVYSPAAMLIAWLILRLRPKPGGHAP